MSCGSHCVLSCGQRQTNVLISFCYLFSFSSPGTSSSTSPVPRDTEANFLEIMMASQDSEVGCNIWLEDDSGPSSVFDSFGSEPGFKMSATNLIVNHLPSSYGEKEVRFIFATYSPRGNAGIKACKVVRDRKSGESKRYAFVEYEDAEDAKMSVEMLAGTKILDYALHVSYALPPSAHPRATTLFVKNFPSYWQNKELAWFFAKFGDILTSNVLYDPITGNSRQIGFVGFKNQKDAERAVETTHTRIPYPGKMGVPQKPLFVEYANSNMDMEYKKKFSR